MTDILCKWLNDDVCVEPKLTKSSFSSVFSNGYLFGELLHKHGLQSDFTLFSKSRSSEAKLNNFTRLEPTFKLLEIPFNINMARDLMTEKPGVATRLLYQLYVALNRVKDNKVQSLQSMRAPGKLKLERIETRIFQKKLKQQTPRQVDLNFEGLIQKFQERQKVFEEKLLTDQKKKETKIQRERREVCHKSLERSREFRESQSVLYTRLKPLYPSKPSPTRSKTTGSVPGHSGPSKPSPTRSKTTSSVPGHSGRSQAAEALATRASIDSFEAGLSLRSATRPHSTGSMGEGTAMIKTKRPSSDYVTQIRQRVQDNELARKEREKRRRKVLVEQMEALQEQENVRRERVLVERLMRQCQQERRVATQLMAIRKEKDTIRNNRIHRQQQYEEQRLIEFNHALDRERELAVSDEQERADKLKHHQSVYKQLRASKAQLHYHRNYKMCQDMLLLMVDLSSKLAEYRELTRGLVPAKLVVDWKTLFVAGKSVYDDPSVTTFDPVDPLAQSMDSIASSNIKRNHHQLLGEADLNEYQSAVHAWSPPEDFSAPALFPRPPNSILCHIVYRLLDMVDPPKPPPSPPSYPKFLFRASIMGRPFAGKSTILKRLEQDVPMLHILNPENLVTKALGIYLSEKRLLESQLSTGSVETDQPTTPLSVEAFTLPSDPPPSAEPAMEATNEENCPRLGSEINLSESLVSQLSELGKLGHRAHLAVVSGEALDDETIVNILTTEMKSLPDGSGFILDNFPLTMNQMITLLTAVLGVTAPPSRLSREFKLLPQDADLSRDPGPVSDLILQLQVSTDNVLQRASKTAPDEQLSGNRLEQVHHRLLTFDTEWPQLRRWILKFGDIVTINANGDIDSVYEVVRDKIQGSIFKAKHSDSLKELGLSPEASGLMSGSTSTLLSKTPSKKTSPIKSSPSRRARRPSSASTSSHLTLLSSATSGHDPLAQLNEKQSQPLIEPGDPGWSYCDRPLNPELATGLAQVWPGLEEVYLRTLEEVFQELRAEREAVCHYFYDKRTEFRLYLCRPDAKQEFVSQWQDSYNNLAPHLRRVVLMKRELHKRVDDLCEKLCDISDHRRDSAYEERERVLTDQWLEDHIGIITNHHISLLQAELDRFYSTTLLLKDYYTGMEDKVPAKLPDPGRLSLIELLPTEAQDPPPSNTTSTNNMKETANTAEEPTTTITVLSPKRDTIKRKVPLLPRQLLPEPTEDKVSKKKGGVAAPLSPPPPVEETSGLELDEQLVVHAYNCANAFIFTTVTHEVRVLECVIAELSKPPVAAPPVEPPPPEPSKSDKGKKNKGKSPAPGKKGKAAKTPPEPPPPEPPVITLSSSVVAERLRAVPMHKEHRAALEQEEIRVKLRLELIKLKCLEQIKGIKESACVLSGEMEEWLGEVFQQEVSCVTSLAEILRQAIENEEKLLKELVLPGPSINIKESYLHSYPTPPPSPPPPTEPTHPHTFTASQLLALHSQLSSVSPDGYLLTSTLVDTLVGLAQRNNLPDLWSTLSREQFEGLCEGVYGVEGDMVDWRRLLLALAQPWTTPTAEQLVSMVTTMKGRVSREEYGQTRIWLDESGEERDSRLKQAFFEILSDPSTDSLDLTSMLLYMSSDPSPGGQGLVKALSVVTGTDLTSSEEATLSLEDLYKALTHSSYPEAPPITTSDLFNLFVSLSPDCPNEVALTELLAREGVWNYLTSISPYHLPVLAPYMRSRPVSMLTETD